jgi:hypothetical protein
MVLPPIAVGQIPHSEKKCFYALLQQFEFFDRSHSLNFLVQVCIDARELFDTVQDQIVIRSWGVRQIFRSLGFKRAHLFFVVFYPLVILLYSRLVVFLLFFYLFIQFLKLSIT